MVTNFAALQANDRILDNPLLVNPVYRKTGEQDY